MTEHLSLADLLDACERYGYGPVVDIGLVAAAVARPATSIAGDDAYPDLVTKAAALLDSLCRNHGLLDGQKRLALLGTATFLRLNGADLDLDDDARHDLVLEIADGRLRGLDAIVGRMPLRPWSAR